MAAGHQPPERVDSYLKRLPLHDKLRLMEQLESVRLYDNQVANANIVLNALRDDLREAGAMPQRRLRVPRACFSSRCSRSSSIDARTARGTAASPGARSPRFGPGSAATCCPKRPRPTPI